MSEEEILQSLRRAIELDRNYFVKVKIDKNLYPIRKQVDKLVREIQQEAKIKLEREISKAEWMAKRMEEWFKSKFCGQKARNNFSSTCSEIQEAKRMFGRHGYFDYLKALEVMEDIKEDFEDAQESIRNDFMRVRLSPSSI